jgi:hypothetical protein
MLRLISLLALSLVLAVATPAGAAPEGRSEAPAGQLTWATHITLAPTWFDPAETPGSRRRSWCCTRCTTRS